MYGTSIKDHMGPKGKKTSISIISFCMSLIVSISSCSSSAGIFSGGSWQSTGLQHQQIRVLVVDPNDPRKLYTAGLHRGVSL
jgi:hypothetical protein